MLHYLNKTKAANYLAAFVIENELLK